MARAQINLKMSSKEEKRRWQQYVEDNPEPDSLSHMIRLAVERYMDGSGEQPTSDRTVQDSGEVLGSLNRIETTLTDMQDRMDALEREQEATEGYELQRVAYQLLPTRSEEPDGIGASEIATRIGAQPGQVRDALETLAEKYTAVSKFDVETDSGEKRTRFVSVGGASRI